MKMKLKLFRIKRKLSQEEMAARIGCTRARYACIESGKRAGKKDFWDALQTAFGLPDARMWELMDDE